jgi:pimeloyl-ACP methyl ester carboxylesterase
MGKRAGDRGTTVEAPAVIDLADTRLRCVTVHGYRRAYRMVGTGPVLLLLHGIGDSSESWLPVLSALARHHTVVAPDLLGHGASDKPRADYAVAAYANRMRDLLDVLGIEAATMVGHSLGGGVAAQLAYQFPERCERLVLVAAGGSGPRRVAPAATGLGPAGRRLPGAGPVAGGPPAGAHGPGAVRPARRRPGPGPGARLLHPGGAGRRRRPAGFTRTLRSVVDWRGQVITLLDRCYLVDAVPALVVWGDRDGVIPLHHGQKAHEAPPAGRLEVFAGAGHLPHHDDPDRFVALVREVVATTEPVRHDRDAWHERLRRCA